MADAVKRLFDDLLNLEINTLVKPGMTGRKMPALGHAFLDILSDYDIWLCKVSGELNGPWAEFLPTGPAQDFVAEMAAKPEESEQWWVMEDGHLLTALEVRPLFDADNPVSAVQFEELRKQARRALDMHRLLLANGIVAPGPDVMLKRIVRNCDQLKTILTAHRITGGAGAASLSRSSPTGLTGASDETFSADEVVTIRKVWELGTEAIIMQTVVQLDGDVVTRLNSAIEATEQSRLRDVHREGVGTAVSSWRALVDTVVSIAGNAAQFLRA